MTLYLMMKKMCQNNPHIVHKPKKKEKGNRRTEGRASRLLYHLVTPLHFFFSVGHRINYTPTSTGLAGYCISKIVCSLYTLIFMCRSLHKALKSLTSKIQITPL